MAKDSLDVVRRFCKTFSRRDPGEITGFLP